MLIALVGGALYSLEHGAVPATVLAVVFVIALPAVLVAERVVPYDPAWNRDQGDLRTDVVHGVVSNALLEGYKRFMLLLFVPTGAWISARLGVSLWPHHWPLAM